MGEVEFVYRGEQFRLTRQQVIDAMRSQTPEPIHTWAMEIEGRRFPVTQVWECATGQSRREFRTYPVMRMLEQLGFRSFQTRPGVGRPAGRPDGAAAAATDDPTPAPDDRALLDRRLAALDASLRLFARRPEVEVGDILEAAEAFETWLTR